MKIFPFDKNILNLFDCIPILIYKSTHYLLDFIPRLSIFLLIVILSPFVPGSNFHPQANQRSNQNSKIPNFAMKDQFGKSIQSSNFQNKALILVGCLPEDESICRKVGRKIYWKIQTYAYGKEDQISAIGYLMLKDTNKEVAQSLIPKFQSSGYESVYLDWNGDLKKGIRSGKVYVRGYNSKGSLIVNEYWTEANNNSVKELYNRVLPESTKN